MTPTSILGKTSPATAADAPADSSLALLPRTAAPIVPVADIDTGAIIVTPEQRKRCEKELRALDFASMPAPQVAIIGREAEQGLHKTLDGFLQRLDTKTAATLFKLFDKLQAGVNDADLPAVLAQVQAVDKPGLWARIAGFFTGKNLQQLVNAAHQKLRDMMEGKTKTLSDVMNGLERDLETECRKLLAELQVLETLKHSYAQHREEFAVATATAHAFLMQSRAYVAGYEVEVQAAPDPLKQAKLQELQDKLQMLESRALALEGTYTRLPADQMVIQQIESAGVSTLQETVTTASARFASIKMTLLALHGALTVKSVQAMSDQQAKLDAQLQTVRGQLMKEIATTAANAPGNNRLAQAAQIEKLIVDTKAINEIVKKAREDNAAKFADARAKFQQARDDLAHLS